MKEIKGISKWIAIICIICTLSACTGSSNDEVSLEDAEITLKIAVPDNLFEKSFLGIIEQYFPKLKIEFVNYLSAVGSAKWKEWLEANNPDLIVSLYPGMYRQMLNDGLLTPLDQFIERDQLDLSPYVPGAIEWLRMQDANHQLYGLATDYTTFVLLYNPEHFDNFKIPYPSLKMTWSDVLLLAQRFQYDEQQVYGLQHHAITPFGLIIDIGRTEELRLYDEETGEIFVRTEAWKSIWELVLKSYEMKSIKEAVDLFPSDTAMVVMPIFIGYEYLRVKTSNWKLAYFPVSGKSPDASHNLMVNRPISIYSKSPNQEYAWNLLKFIIGEDTARYVNVNNLAGIPIHSQMISNSGLENAQVFYAVKPKLDSIPEISKLLPTFTETSKFYELGNQIFHDVLLGNKTLDEGLEQLEIDLKSFFYERLKATQ